MEENVALESTNQKKFQKSITGIKKLIKSGKIKPDKVAKRAKGGKAAQGVQKKKKRAKGLVYISHIPHGFYENEMTQYFKQFGVVTNARVIRSKRTGQSKGCAFVEFLEPTVAQIVTETMNNYLMGKRLLKAVIIPPEKQKVAFRKHWNAVQNPGAEYKRKMKMVYNTNGTKADEIKNAKKILKCINETKKKLQEIGINYDFFKPVDVPEELLPLMDVDAVQKVEVTDEPKKQIKAKNETIKENDKKKEKIEQKLSKRKDKKKGKIEKELTKLTDNPKKAETPKALNAKKEKVNNKKELPASMKKDIQDLADFIKINTAESENASGSDSEVDEFNSDEFEMTLESDEELGSEDDEDGSDGELEFDNGSDDASDKDIVVQQKKIHAKTKSAQKKTKGKIEKPTKRKQSAPEFIPVSKKNKKGKKKFVRA